MERLKCTDESDYFLLHTIISLVSFAVGSEDLPSQERVRKLVSLISQPHCQTGDDVGRVPHQWKRFW